MIIIIIIIAGLQAASHLEECWVPAVCCCPLLLVTVRLEHSAVASCQQGASPPGFVLQASSTTTLIAYKASSMSSTRRPCSTDCQRDMSFFSSDNAPTCRKLHWSDPAYSGAFLTEYLPCGTGRSAIMYRMLQLGMVESC